MRVFVGGATGYIGAAVAKALKARGHEVLGSARNEEAAKKLTAAGHTPVTADLADAASFGKAAKEADAIIQTASTSGPDSPDVEPKAARAILEAIAGTEKRFILTSGVWVYGKTDSATEETKTNAIPLVGWRGASEDEVMKAGGIVVRPGIVHGHGGGIAAMFVGSAKQQKKVNVPGDGTNRWCPIHVDDLGELYAVVLEKGQKGAIYNGTSDEIITLGDVGKAIAKRHGAEYGTWPLAEAQKAMGGFADALALDQVVKSPKSRALGWAPKGITLAADLATGSYG
ncbi:MAG TPA: NAD-dependent epimerase/dehydratase family protein [Polyangiaceae bacterium]